MFCGTWYLPHSRVHKSMAELCSNFGDSAITNSQIAYFSCICAKRLYFYYESKIWRHPRVPRPRFPIRWRNYGDSATSKGQIAYFSLHMRAMAIFLLPVKNLTSPSCTPTQISYKIEEFWRFGHKYGPTCIFELHMRETAIFLLPVKIWRHHWCKNLIFCSLILVVFIVVYILRAN